MGFSREFGGTHVLLMDFSPCTELGICQLNLLSHALARLLWVVFRRILLSWPCEQHLWQHQGPIRRQLLIRDYDSPGRGIAVSLQNREG